MTFVIIFVIILSVAYVHSLLSCNISDENFDSLYSLFEACDGVSWKWNSSEPNSSHWSFPNTLSAPCSDEWQGVTCTLFPDNSCSITEIKLVGMGLSGSLPSNISQLGDLTALQLDHNDIHSSLPSEIGLLSDLNFLSLLYNNIGGTIPSTIYSLTQMRTLILGFNQLSGAA